MKKFDVKMLLLLSAGHMATDIYQGVLQPMDFPLTLFLPVLLAS